MAHVLRVGKTQTVLLIELRPRGKTNKKKRIEGNSWEIDLKRLRGIFIRHLG
jgi:hypothetical protein